MCGIDGEVEWLTRATCKGGSRPIPTPDAATSRRDSYMRRGGRCNSILERVRLVGALNGIERYVGPMP